MNLLNIAWNQSWLKFKRPIYIFQLLTSEYLISMLKLSLKWLFYLPKFWFNSLNARFGSLLRHPCLKIECWLWIICDYICAAVHWKHAFYLSIMAILTSKAEIPYYWYYILSDTTLLAVFFVFFFLNSFLS